MNKLVIVFWAEIHCDPDLQQSSGRLLCAACAETKGPYGEIMKK